MNIATNAEPIMAARMAGKKPADMVIVSLVGPVVTENPIVFAKAEEKYDWRWVRDLDVCVHINGEVDWQELLMAIALQHPSYLSLWDAGAQWGARVYLIPRASDIGKPVKAWKFEIDFSLWHDFQNADFIAGRTYQRDNNGMPYALG
jgi:hypothetical protein